MLVEADIKQIFARAMQKNHQYTSIILFVLLAITWGSSFILMKRGLISFTPVQIGAIRIGYATLFTALIGFKTFKYFRWKVKKSR